MLRLRRIKGKLTSVGVADERIEEMIGHGRQMRCLWVYAADAEPCSAMTGILTELQKKVRRFHQSPETFWLHNRSIVNRDLIEFHSWRTPVPLPWTMDSDFNYSRHLFCTVVPCRHFLVKLCLLFLLILRRDTYVVLRIDNSKLDFSCFFTVSRYLTLESTN